MSDKLIKKNRFDLDPERLATTDEAGHRVYLYPEDVEGFWKKRRELFYWFLIILYLVLPWFNINGKPALMLNIFTREFSFMGFTMHGVEPILVFLVVDFVDHLDHQQNRIDNILYLEEFVLILLKKN